MHAVHPAHAAHAAHGIPYVPEQCDNGIRPVHVPAASDSSWATPMLAVSVSCLELLPACCGRASCRLLQGKPWHLDTEQQERLVNACRALRGWKPRHSRSGGVVTAEDAEGTPVWPDVVVDADDSDSDTGESSSGASVSTSVGGGTLTVGYSQQTLKEAQKDTAVAAAFASANATSRTAGSTAATEGDLAADGDSTVVGATFAMSLDADTSLSVGIQNAKDADSDSTSQFDASVSRSLGGGASVFLDIRSLNGDAATDGSAVAVGTSVSF